MESRKLGWLIGGGFAFVFLVTGVAAVTFFLIKSHSAEGKTHVVKDVLVAFEGDMDGAKVMFFDKRVEVVGVVDSVLPAPNGFWVVFAEKTKSGLYLIGTFQSPKSSPPRPGMKINVVGIPSFREDSPNAIVLENIKSWYPLN